LVHKRFLEYVLWPLSQDGAIHFVRPRSVKRIDQRTAPDYVRLVGIRRGLGVLLALVVLGVPPTVVGQDPVEGPPRVLEGDAPDPRTRTPSDAVLGVPGLDALGLVPGRPRISPTRTDNPPRIDGVLDDPVWETAVQITELIQEAPIEGAPATEATEVYVTYDSENLYFGFYAHYQNPSIMRANQIDRDQARQDDVVRVFLDPFLDQQRAYVLDVNGYGVQGDGIITPGGGGGGGRGGGGRGGGGRGGGGGGGGNNGSGIPGPDRSWDALFDSGGRLVEDGFTAEMAIPFKSLRYPEPAEGEPHRWGLQILRRVRGKDQENQVWAPMSRDESSFFAQMGVLEGMTDLSTSRNLEILPTFTGIMYGAIDPVEARFVSEDADPDAGVNVKYGLTSDLTADLTINPDFSQIESDQPQIEVNQRFPLFFGELRPFFLEGAEIFQISAPVTFVHTRTIVDPDYGAKVSGQLGRFAIGVLAANDRAPGNVDDPDDRAFEQGAQNFIARARYDLYAESNIGAIFTNREFLDSHSRVFGADGNFRLTPTISADFRAVGSRYKELEEAEVDGHMIATRIQQSGRNVSWSLVANQVSPEFDTDVGFVRRTDTRTASGNVRYRFWPESWVINWGPEINYGRTYDYDDILLDENLSLRVNSSFAQSINVFSNIQREREYESELLARGEFLDWRSDLLRGTVPRASGQLEAQRGPAPIRPAPGGRPVRESALHGSRERGRRAVQHQDPEGYHDIPVYPSSRAQEHHGVEHRERDLRSQRPLQLSRERRDGLLPRLRRPLPAGQSDRGRSGRGRR
jgi:hypothetical protein